MSQSEFPRHIIDEMDRVLVQIGVASDQIHALMTRARDLAVLAKNTVASYDRQARETAQGEKIIRHADAAIEQERAAQREVESALKSGKLEPIPSSPIGRIPSEEKFVPAPKSDDDGIWPKTLEQAATEFVVGTLRAQQDAAGLNLHPTDGDLHSAYDAKGLRQTGLWGTKHAPLSRFEDAGTLNVSLLWRSQPFDDEPAMHRRYIRSGLLVDEHRQIMLDIDAATDWAPYVLVDAFGATHRTSYLYHPIKPGLVPDIELQPERFPGDGLLSHAVRSVVLPKDMPAAERAAIIQDIAELSGHEPKAQTGSSPDAANEPDYEGPNIPDAMVYGWDIGAGGDLTVEHAYDAHGVLLGSRIVDESGALEEPVDGPNEPEQDAPASGVATEQEIPAGSSGEDDTGADEEHSPPADSSAPVDQPPAPEFYEDVDPAIVSDIQSRADEVMAGDEYELISEIPVPHENAAGAAAEESEDTPISEEASAVGHVVAEDETSITVALPGAEYENAAGEPVPDTFDADQIDHPALVHPVVIGIDVGTDIGIVTATKDGKIIDVVRHPAAEELKSALSNSRWPEPPKLWPTPRPGEQGYIESKTAAKKEEEPAPQPKPESIADIAAKHRASPATKFSEDVLKLWSTTEFSEAQIARELGATKSLVVTILEQARLDGDPRMTAKRGVKSMRLSGAAKKIMDRPAPTPRPVSARPGVEMGTFKAEPESKLSTGVCVVDLDRNLVIGYRGKWTIPSNPEMVRTIVMLNDGNMYGHDRIAEKCGWASVDHLRRNLTSMMEKLRDIGVQMTNLPVGVVMKRLA